jgi:hypothetical protein
MDLKNGLQNIETSVDLKQLESVENLTRIAKKYGYDVNQFLEYFFNCTTEDIVFASARELTESDKEAQELIELARIFNTTI